MQRDRGLARCRRRPLTTRTPGSVGTDGFVLLGLDRGDDVAHAAGAGAVERREQRALAHDGQTRGLGGVAVEHLVVDADELAARRW